MKTLVVLSALASVAFAAPYLPGKDYTKSDVWQGNIRRDKKSPQGYFFAESTPVHFADPQLHINSEFDSPQTARTFGSKKPTFRPTIIKNHHGYQLYRDSEEERAQADPMEDCSKQVKVKLCDKHNKESKAFTRSVIDNSNIQEDNMKSRIKLAKEAIEDIQREMKNKEQSPKSTGWTEREVESDAEFQQDIEVARKALDHIHRNFGNLESMSLHKEPSQQGHDGILKENDTQRLAQWKENIEAINKNVEVGRNIEDSFLPDDQQPSLNSELIDTTQLMKNSEKEEAKFHEMPAKEDTLVSKERTVSTEINKGKDINDDMHIAATTLDSKIEKPVQKLVDNQNMKAKNSEPVSMKAASEHQDNSDKKSPKPLENDDSQNWKAKNSEPVSMKAAAEHQNNSDKKSMKPLENVDSQNPKVQNSEPVSMKAAEEHQDNSDKKSMKPLENVDSQNPKVQNSEPVSMKAAEEHQDNSDKKSLKPLENINENELSNGDGSKMKAADNLEKMKAVDHFQKNTDVEMSQKSNMPSNQQKKTWPDTKSAESPTNTLAKNADQEKEKQSTNLETSEIMKSAEHEKELKNINNEQVPSSKIQEHQHTKSADNIDAPHMRWAALNTGNIENKPQVKAADEFQKEHLKGMHMHMHHMDAAAAPSNHLQTTHGHAPHTHFTKIHEHSHHGKSSDMDGFFQPNLQMNLGDFSGKSAMENALQWTHNQDGGRAAYGPYGAGGYGSGGGSGAVGVFPNAHVGGCAVPLLLSCSPSVVSGSLAKSSYGHAPSYGVASSYKAAEGNNHMKRDIKKTNEISKNKFTHKTVKSKAATEKKI